MTDIATMEDLRALDAGTTVNLTPARSVATQSWTVTDDGHLERDGTRLPLSMFESALAEAPMRTGPIYTQQQVWAQPSGLRAVVCNVREDASADVVLHQGLQYHSFQQWLPSPDYTQGWELGTFGYEHGDHLAYHLGHAQVQLAAARARTDRGRTDLFADMGRELANVIGTFDDTDDSDVLRAWMRGRGIPLPTQTTNVRINVEGRTELQPDTPEPNPIEGINWQPIDAPDSVSGYWSTTVQGEVESSDPDPCEDVNVVNEDWVCDRLDELGMRYDRDSITIEGRACDLC